MKCGNASYLEKDRRGIELGYPAVVHYQDAVGIHDGVEAVGDAEHCAVSERSPGEPRFKIKRYHVNRRK